MKPLCCIECGRPFETVAGITIDRGLNRITREGFGTANLEPRQCEIMELLIGRAGRPISRWGIFDSLYGAMPDCDQPEPKIIDVHICKLRHRVCALGLSIICYWGQGYAIKLEDAPVIRIGNAWQRGEVASLTGKWNRERKDVVAA